MGAVVTRGRFVFALLLLALFQVLPALAGPGPLDMATALTAGVAAAVVCAVLWGRPEAAVPMHVRAVSLRERARLATFVPSRDPDAPGRTRPRAPGSGSATA